MCAVLVSHPVLVLFNSKERTIFLLRLVLNVSIIQKLHCIHIDNKLPKVLLHQIPDSYQTPNIFSQKFPFSICGHSWQYTLVAILTHPNTLAHEVPVSSPGEVEEFAKGLSSSHSCHRAADSHHQSGISLVLPHRELQVINTEKNADIIDRNAIPKHKHTEKQLKYTIRSKYGKCITLAFQIFFEWLWLHATCQYTTTLRTTCCCKSSKIRGHCSHLATGRI